MDLSNFKKFCWCLDLKNGIKLIAIITFVYHFSPFIAFVTDVFSGYLNDEMIDKNNTHWLLWTSWLVPSFMGFLSAIFLIVAILLVFIYEIFA